MNKHSIFAPVADPAALNPRTPLQRIIGRLRVYRAFLLVVAAPTLLLAAYLYMVAADQYQSEAHFVVRSAQGPTTPVQSGFGQLLGAASGLASSASEGASVTDFLVSHDAVAAIRQRADLVERFRRPEADLFSKLRPDNPTPEKLLSYYKSKVKVHTDRESGIITLKVRAFRPDDAYVIIQDLLQLSEQRVNALNQRSYNDSIAAAKAQLDDAENGVSSVQKRMTELRVARGDIDPQGAGEAQIKVASEVNTNLIAARTQLATMGALISHNSPQYVGLARQVRSLEGELAAQSKFHSGKPSNIATDLGAFEDLRVRQEFAAKHYEAAAADLEKAREQAQRQQLYLIRIVEPNRPIKSQFPERGRILLTVFAGLMLLYSMGWLLAAGVREHAA